MRRWLGSAGAAAILAVVLSPVFFIIFRLMIFKTVPRDEYAPFLLWLLGQPGGVFPASPYGYRILTMIAAAPFYYVLPNIALTKIPDTIALPYLRATAAIAALSFVCMIGAGTAIYRLAVDRAGLNRTEALCAGALMFVFCLYSEFVAVDPLAILIICLGLYVIHRPLAYTVLLFASVVCNEKVAIVFVIWLTIRWVLCAEDRRRLLVPWLTSLAALVVYGAIVMFVRLPGHGYQTDPTAYPFTLWQNLMVYPTARGLLLNLLPIAVLTVIALMSWQSIKDSAGTGMFRPVDILVIFGMVLVALVLTQLFQAGRIVVHASPLFVVPAGRALGRWLQRRESIRSSSS